MRALLVAAGMLLGLSLLTTGPAPTIAQEAPPTKAKPSGASGGGAGNLAAARNDAMATPRLASTPYSVEQANFGTGTEAGEVVTCGTSSLGSTLWYRWVAPADGLYMATTSGSDFDTIIALYDDSLTQLTCSDDVGDESEGLLSVIRFEAQADATYFLQAGGFETAEGNLRLLLAPIVGARDEAGDTFNSGLHDLVKAEATITRQQSQIESLLLRFEFADAVSPPSVGGDRALGGLIDLDTRFGANGRVPWRNIVNSPHPSISMVSEYYIHLDYEAANPGFVGVYDEADALVVSLPIVFRQKGFTIEIPWGALDFELGPTYAAVFGPPANLETDAFPNADPPPDANCSAPWFAETETDGGCLAAGGLWHEELPTPPQGMSGSTLAYNFGCNGIQALSGCQYSTGSRTTGTATLRPIGPLPEGAQIWFRNMRVVSDGVVGGNTCPYDFTRAFGGASGSTLLGLIAEPGGSHIVEAKICGSSAIEAHDIIAPLPAGTSVIAFEFDSTDEFNNLGAGQFIDQVVICPPEIACDTDSDFCPDAAEQGVDPALGGARNWWDPWDFYDVNGNGNVDLSDTLELLGLFGFTPATPGYDALYDRMVPNTNEPWRTAAATGDAVGIDLQDALANLGSFGHNCVA